MEIALVVECAGIVEVTRRPQPGDQFDVIAIKEMRKLRRVCFNIVFAQIAGKDFDPNPNRLRKSHSTDLHRLGFHIKTLARACSGAKHTVIRYMGSDLDITLQEFRWWNNNARSQGNSTGICTRA